MSKYILSKTVQYLMIIYGGTGMFSSDLKPYAGNPGIHISTLPSIKGSNDIDVIIYQYTAGKKPGMDVHYSSLKCKIIKKFTITKSEFPGSVLEDLSFGQHVFSFSPDIYYYRQTIFKISDDSITFYNNKLRSEVLSKYGINMNENFLGNINGYIYWSKDNESNKILIKNKSLKNVGELLLPKPYRRALGITRAISMPDGIGIFCTAPPRLGDPGASTTWIEIPSPVPVQ